MSAANVLHSKATAGEFLTAHGTATGKTQLVGFLTADAPTYGWGIVGPHFVGTHAPWPGPHIPLIYEEADGPEACWEVWTDR